MAVTNVNDLTSIGNLASGDKLVGERVDGTTVRITYTPTSQTTIGTLTTGVWQATTIDVAYGGSGRTSATAYTPIIGGTTSTGAHQSMATAGSAGQIMQSAGASAVPVWSTATYPSTASTSGKRLKSDGTNLIMSTTTMPDAGTSGKLIRGDGTNYVESTSTFADTYAASTILYSNGANTVTGLATANSGVLVTDGSGVPSIATDIPTAVTIGGQYVYRVAGTDVSVADGGTGVSTMTTAYAPVCAGTTATGALQVASTGLSTAGYVLTSNGASALPSFQASSGSDSPQTPGGRLTLATGTPVTTADQTGKTTIYYTPYMGDKIPIYNGSSFTNTTFTELSVATSDTTKSPAAIGASKVNDWFVWNDGGTIRIGHGPDWTDDNTRSAGTALTMVNGIYLNNATITNGPAASRGTYVGTTRSNSSSQLSDSASLRHTWNLYNRTPRSMVCAKETADSWTYTTATFRQANANTANQLDFCVGLIEDQVYAEARMICRNSSLGVYMTAGIGTNSTSVNSATTVQGATAAVVSQNFQSFASYVGYPVLGRNTLVQLEYSAATGTTTFFGDGGFTGNEMQTGIFGTVIA